MQTFLGHLDGVARIVVNKVYSATTEVQDGKLWVTWKAWKRDKRAWPHGLSSSL